MKNSKYIIALAAFLITSVANATVRTLNNNFPSPGQFTTWANVQAASAIGDTVYVSGSPLSYGNITVTLYNLCIIGTGYNPQKQNPLVSEFDNISATVGQIRISGIKCKVVQVYPGLGAAALHADNCYIIRVLLISSSGYNSAAYLRNNVIVGELYPGLGGHTFLNTDDLTGEISNNICFGQLLASSPYTGLNIYNNLFIADVNGQRLFSSNAGLNYYYSSLFRNNILTGYEDDGIIFNSAPSYINLNVIFENNIVYTSPGYLSSFANHIGMITTNPLFVNVPCINNSGAYCLFNPSYDYHLSVSSPGKNYGTDGTDIGPYGGPYGATFTTYGEPSIPQMKQMNMPAAVPSGSSFNVNIISTVK